MLIGEGYRTFPVVLYTEFINEVGGNDGFAAAIAVIAIVVTTVVFLAQKYVSNKNAFSLNALHPIEEKAPKGLAGFLAHAASLSGRGNRDSAPDIRQLHLFQEDGRKDFRPRLLAGKLRFRVWKSWDGVFRTRLSSRSAPRHHSPAGDHDRLLSRPQKERAHQHSGYHFHDSLYRARHRSRYCASLPASIKSLSC